MSDINEFKKVIKDDGKRIQDTKAVCFVRVL